MASKKRKQRKRAAALPVSDAVKDSLTSFGLKPVDERMEDLAAAQAAKTAAVKGISRERMPRQAISEDSLIKLTNGKTRITAGSLRDKVLASLRESKEGWTIQQLTKRLKFDVKPVVAKLRAAGWVEVI